MAYAQERYLGLLSQLFTTPEETAMEIIAEREELRFPKPTELFISDIHGEYEEFPIYSEMAAALSANILMRFSVTLLMKTNAAPLQPWFITPRNPSIN
jgi:fructose-1,6-bisphosphatase